MRSTLYLKFISIYLIFGFLCLFTVATLTHELTISELEEDTSDTLYKEATLLANDYLTGCSELTMIFLIKKSSQ